MRRRECYSAHDMFLSNVLNLCFFLTFSPTACVLYWGEIKDIIRSSSLLTLLLKCQLDLCYISCWVWLWLSQMFPTIILKATSVAHVYEQRQSTVQPSLLSLLSPLRNVTVMLEKYISPLKLRSAFNSTEQKHPTVEITSAGRCSCSRVDKQEWR